MTTQELESYLVQFGLSSFRPGQKEVISAVLAGQDCLCIMPTGGGKSLCYQLPSIAREGVTLVISPLIALMKDQVDALRRLNLRATFINSSLTLAEQRERLDGLAQNEFDLVYVAPERLRSPLFLEAANRARIRLLAVDEAHCISEWGHDFRPDYARLGQLRQRLGKPQTIALTATATPHVRQDVVQLLALEDPQLFITGFARPNLDFEVVSTSTVYEKNVQLLRILREIPGSGIIYASTRRRCEEVVSTLREHSRRRVGMYHAGLSPDERHGVQEAFMADEIDTIVATNAFGMGIDKPDLRFVVHYNMPGSLEAYYQEAGRAGRDGQTSRCLLLFSHADRHVQEYFIENSYPEPGQVARVYEYLRKIDENPIEITLEQLKERLDLPLSPEGIGACQQILERAGALERLSSHQNLASITVDTDAVSLIDMVPREATKQRRVLRAIERLVGDRRYERVYFQLQTLARLADLDRDALQRALRRINELEVFDYLPPFRGRAVHMRKRRASFSELGIDFQELAQRKASEMDKLERVIRYAMTRGCRQMEILEYFGDPERKPCGTCDNCRQPSRSRATQAHEQPSNDVTLEVTRIVLSGVARARGRFGKQVIAQMLCGSNSAKITRWRLNELSTFGLLGFLTQQDTVLLIDELQHHGLIEQQKVERFRPTLHLTPLGRQVMRGEAPPGDLQLPATVAAKLRHAAPATLVARGEPERDPAPEPVARSGPSVSDAKFPDTKALLERTYSDSEDDWDGIDVPPMEPPEYVGLSYDEPDEPLLPAEEPALEDGLPDSEPLAAESLEQESLEDHESLEDAAAEDESEADGQPAYYWTWRLFERGFSLDECALIRRLDSAMILQHAVAAIRANLPVQVSSLFPAEELDELERTLGELEQLPPAPHWPRGIDSDRVRLYWLCRRARHRSPS